MLLQKETSGLFHLIDRSVDLWPVGVSASDEVVAAFHRVLAPEEAARAFRFHLKDLRRSYIIAHGALRFLLGRYLGIAAANVRFGVGHRGKPKLDMPTRVKFNLSHSGVVALLGFTLDCEIGVDLENLHSVQDMLGIATRFFCADEAAELMSLAPPAEREAAFFRCWTRKEAYLKAVGEGLNEPLDSFRVNLRPGIPARLIHIQNSTVAASEWTLHDIDSIPQYSAALAYRDVPRPIRALPLLSPSELLNIISSV